MAGKKREGLGGLKDTTGGKGREDRLVTGKTTFELITLDAKNALTVIYMLQSPEDNIVLKAIVSLEGFGRKGVENLKTLTYLGVFPYLFPLIRHSDNIIRRFSLKLFGMLCCLEEFREQVLRVENVLEGFVGVMEKETDIVLHEYAALVLAELSSEYHAASELLRVENLIDLLFLRITSPDPDVEKNCLDIMNHLLNDINGIEAFVASSAFDMRLILDLVPSNYPVIQALAIEALKQLTSWCRDTRVLFAFRDSQGVELTLDVLERDDWSDLHQSALELLMNVVDSPDLCEYLMQSGCLMRVVRLMETTLDKAGIEKVLGVLARMSQSKKGRTALHSVGMEEKFCDYLGENHEGILESSCLGIANMAQSGICLDSIMEANPVTSLLGLVTSREKNLNLRNTAAYALNVLCNFDRRASEILLGNGQAEELFTILTENSHLPTELCRNLIQIFMGISFYDSLRAKLITETFLKSLLACIPKADTSATKDTSVLVDALECLSGFLIESEARFLFNSLDGAKIIINCLHSKFASVREWAGHLVIVAAQDKDFVKSFIQNNGLEWMMNEKNTMQAMPSWQAGIEAIFSGYLPAKFAYTGRLDLHDITQDGFYVSSNPCSKFTLLDYFFKCRISPLHPIYVANFYSTIGSSSESETDSIGSRLSESKSHQSVPASKTTDFQNQKKFMKGADRNTLEDFVWDGSLNTYQSISYADSVKIGDSECNLEKICPDPCLNEYLEDLKRKIAKAESSSFGDTDWKCIHPNMVCERARIIGELVADEMSGPEADPICSCHYKQMHINELKFHLGSNVIPLGLIRMGSYLERALLFKVLSDRIGFPCALVRGPHGRSWVEISVPVINIEDVGEETEDLKVNAKSSVSEGKISTRSLGSNRSSKSFSLKSMERQGVDSVLQEGSWFPKLRLECFKAFPNYLLKTNAIVDLINVPGRVLRMNTVEAEEYMGALLFNKC